MRQLGGAAGATIVGAMSVALAAIVLATAPLGAQRVARSGSCAPWRPWREAGPLAWSWRTCDADGGHYRIEVRWRNLSAAVVTASYRAVPLGAACADRSVDGEPLTTLAGRLTLAAHQDDRVPAFVLLPRRDFDGDFSVCVFRDGVALEPAASVVSASDSGALPAFHVDTVLSLLAPVASVPVTAGGAVAVVADDPLRGAMSLAAAGDVRGALRTLRMLLARPESVGDLELARAALRLASDAFTAASAGADLDAKDAALAIAIAADTLDRSTASASLVASAATGVAEALIADTSAAALCGRAARARAATVTARDRLSALASEDSDRAERLRERLDRVSVSLNAIEGRCR